ncbi:MAG: PIN domain-containing protein [Dethiobacter sp.]|jgi:predicted nucleic acid-binding protein|nr:MAG: PIN domain-containing protein [Dethiobacter sp.]
MRKKIIVPDASVLLKWAFKTHEEDYSDKALLLLESWLGGEVEIVLPGLWCYEVGNVLMLKSPELAPDLMEVFLSYDFQVQEMTLELCRVAFSIMRKSRVTFYDAVYHAVAILHEGTLLTADEAYARKVAEVDHVTVLKDLPFF